MERFIDQTRTFLREVVGELRKVVWPSRDRIVKLTGVVVAMVLIVAGFLFLIDMGMNAIMAPFFG